MNPRKDHTKSGNDESELSHRLGITQPANSGRALVYQKILGQSGVTEGNLLRESGKAGSVASNATPNLCRNDPLVRARAAYNFLDKSLTTVRV